MTKIFLPKLQMIHLLHRWDICDMDLWLECMTAKAMQSQCWLCPHCGATNHFHDRCLFHPSSSSVGISNVGISDTGSGARQRAPSQLSYPRRAQLQSLIRHDYNNTGCHRSFCNYRHKINVSTTEVTTQSGVSSSRGCSDIVKPLPWTPL